MSEAWLAGVGVMVLVLLTGNGSGSRLRSYLRQPPTLHPSPTPTRRAWPGARRNRTGSVVAGLDVPTSLALELRSGRDLPAALTAVADELSDHLELAARLRAAARSAATAAPVGPTLAGDADRLGRALQVTAVCCDVSTSAGLPLAQLLDAVADEARGRILLAGRAKAELAAARSTSVVLACLPLVGLAMGQLLGARPFHVLLATRWGVACLLGALVLTGAGAVWSGAIAASAARSLP